MRLRRTNRARIIGTAADRTVRYGPPFRVPGRRRFPWRRWRTGPASHRRPSVRRRRWSAARNRRRRSGARACVTGRRRSRRAWRTRRTGRPRRPPPVHRRRRAAHRGRRTTTQWRAATYRWGGGRARTTSSTVRRWCRRSVDVEGLVAAVAPPETIPNISRGCNACYFSSSYVVGQIFDVINNVMCSEFLVSKASIWKKFTNIKSLLKNPVLELKNGVTY